MLAYLARPLAAALLVSSSALALAQDRSPAPAPELGPLPAIQVTATRTPQPIQRAGSAITVIGPEEIARTSARNVDDLLRQVPGVSLVRAGGVGNTQTVRIRGGDVRHTLVLIDGIRVNDPSSTGREFDFSLLALTDLDRIEVLRGPQSALYGSDALGGVVNIITKRGRGGPRATIVAEGGSYGTKELRAGVSGGTDRTFYAFSASGLHTDGFSAYGFRIPRIAARFPEGLEADGARVFGFSGRAGVRLTDTTEVEGGLFASHVRAGYDAAFGSRPDSPNVSDNRLVNGYARLTHDAFDGVLRNRLTVYGNRTERIARDFSYGFLSGQLTGITRSGFLGERRGAEYQGDIALGRLGLLTVGAVAEAERAQTDRQTLFPRQGARAPGIDEDRVTRAGFALWQVSPTDRLHLSFGGRVDDVIGVDRFVTGRATAAYEIRETETKLRASIGNGGKAPSLFQLYSSFGNERLVSERSIGVDAGIDQSLLDGRLVLSATVFANRYRDLIDFASSPQCTPAQVFGCYVNVARAETRGLELSGDLALVPGLLRLRLAYTNLRAVDLTTDLRLARRPENEGRVALLITPTPRLTIEPRLTLVGERFSSNGERDRLAPYARLDVYADYKIDDTFTIFGRAENLTDARYQEVATYGTPGRSFYAGLRATW
jgi:vitamin B12 transporter